MRDAAKRKGRAGGTAMMLGMFFATLFDPKKGAAIVQIDTQRRIGSENDWIATTASAPPTSVLSERD
jgi:hypothetical protein